MQLARKVSHPLGWWGKTPNMPTYRSLVQRGPLLLFAPCRTWCVAGDWGRAGDWLAEGGGERSSSRRGSCFRIYSFHLYWSAHGWGAPTQGMKGLSKKTPLPITKKNSLEQVACVQWKSNALKWTFNQLAKGNCVSAQTNLKCVNPCQTPG